MRVYGVDFTSAPGKRKPLVVVGCTLRGGALEAECAEEMTSLGELEEFLGRPGPWVAGLDFPFGQPRGLVRALGWPEDWSGYVEEASRLSAPGFEAALREDMASRPAGKKHRYRTADRLSGSASAMMLFRVPVGKMFHRGAPLLLRSGVSVVPCRENSSGRLVFESYPALVARRVIGRRPYKGDDSKNPKKESQERAQARRELVDGLSTPAVTDAYGVSVGMTGVLRESFIEEPTADGLDSLLCAVQAAWAWGRLDLGVPQSCDALEGWIPDPKLLDAPEDG